MTDDSHGRCLVGPGDEYPGNGLSFPWSLVSLTSPGVSYLANQQIWAPEAWSGWPRFHLQMVSSCIKAIEPKVCLKPTSVLTAISMKNNSSFIQLTEKAQTLLIIFKLLCLVNCITKKGDFQRREQHGYFSLTYAQVC